MSRVSEIVALEFESPAAERLRFEWPAAELAAFDPDPSREQPIWRLAGELDWDEIEAVRVLSGRLDEQRLIAIAALRPAGADGHGEEVVAGALGDLEAFEQLAETLFSTEYGSDGLPRRVGLELYRSEGGMPIRVAGDATATADLDGGGVRRTSAALTLRAAGAAGAGALDILRPA